MVYVLQRLRAIPLLVWAALVTVLVAVYAPLSVYITYDFSLLLTFILAPFIIYIVKPGQYSWRFGWLTALLLAMYALTGVLTSMYFAIISLLLLVVERYWGRINDATFVLSALSGSITRYFISNIGFPLRLRLSEWAGEILKVMDPTVEVLGNVIIYRGDEYLVDPACMGVNMVITGLVLSLAIMRYFELKQGMPLNKLGLGLTLIFALVMVLCANLVRILALVFTGFPPDTIGHEVVGLLSLVLYAILPVILVLRLLSKRGWLLSNNAAYEIMTPKPISAYPIMVLCAGIAWFGFTYVPQANYVKDSPYLKLRLANYEAQTSKLDVLQLRGEEGLIYIKPPATFYGSDHSPYICWSGSGYVFKQMQEDTLAGIPMYTARLEYKTDTLYTAWWFSNGQQRTIEQLVWRLESLKGKAPFALVNVTSTTPAKLEEQIWIVMNELCL